ncbi:MAG: spore coat protein [Bacilli bacterium]|nr:spore coat protein [Bacilli bacterium]
MEDKYIVMDILDSLKNMSSFMTIALNESSNSKLYNEIFKFFKDVNKETKELFEYALKNNWYQLENEDDNKIKNVLNKLENERN